jgi:uncharacterized membrane protein
MFGFIIGLTKSRLAREAHARAQQREKERLEREAVERNKKEAAAVVRRYGLVGRKRF